MTTPAPRRTSARSVVLETSQTLVQALLLFLILTVLIGRFVVQQTSMEPNFHEGQRVVVSKVGSLWSELFVTTAHAEGKQPATPVMFQHGQIAVFYDTQNRTGDPLIKRVIGLPGDTIAIHDGIVFVNAMPVDELYLETRATECLNVCTAITLAEDEYFVMGDNRGVSRDSRSFGPVHADQFVGRVVARYWPLHDLAVYP